LQACLKLTSAVGWGHQVCALQPSGVLDVLVLCDDNSCVAAFFSANSSGLTTSRAGLT
jgi:hypothetical protein